MHHPLPATHGKRMILGDLQIIHRFRPRHHLPPGHHAHTTIRSQEVHAQFDLAHRQEAVFHREEGVLLVGMHHLARLRGSLAMLSLRGRDGQVHQVVVMVDPHVQDGFLLHLARLRVVGQDAFSHLQGADGLLAVIGGELRLYHRSELEIGLHRVLPT